MFSPNWIEARESQWEKQQAESERSERGILIEGSEVQEWKQVSPKEQIFSWSSTETRELQWEKQAYGRQVRDFGIIIEERDSQK